MYTTLIYLFATLSFMSDSFIDKTYQYVPPSVYLRFYDNHTFHLQYTPQGKLTRMLQGKWKQLNSREIALYQSTTKGINVVLSQTTFALPQVITFNKDFSQFVFQNTRFTLDKPNKPLTTKTQYAFAQQGYTQQNQVKRWEIKFEKSYQFCLKVLDEKSIENVRGKWAKIDEHQVALFGVKGKKNARLPLPSVIVFNPKFTRFGLGNYTFQH
ncbi:hypothetical protein [uncultured Microscilla sp.]|uniref:hypothetical protein n=1 Tax=uncultured Microscilla sp. TaxID=432653 RepID=UPI002628ADA7|nr:hypothetical protein [uncultured Microscilla sp.]